ncbi:hypothetical protein FDK12_07835 [Arthrobacter sp. NamB2]|uniref:hypothetical protein n=1 Tax=Arthrobacter sp. NamB2 TaxID=2576035 RepID=UPI0010C93C56|nr:hypothetical protein [Arthrobacter sp. NamB2]TKV28559.1 hypothetical protein FDK12_07835 [Arthrobacter sp. NamB2]
MKVQKATIPLTIKAKLERDLLAAGRELSKAFKIYEQAEIALRTSPDCLLRPDESMQFEGMSRSFDQALGEWRRAIDLVETNPRVAERSSRGRAWRDPLDPGGLHYFVSLAGPDDLDYRTRLQQAWEREEFRLEAMEEDLAQVCGRATRNGTPCQSLGAYWPGGARKSGCTRHMTPDEKAQLSALWDEVVATIDCPGCVSRAGVACDPDKMVPVDGFFPTPKSFNGRVVHTPRLNAFASST